MRKVHRKIVGGLLLCGCALFTLYGTSRIAEKAENVGIPLSITGMEEVMSVFVFDIRQSAST